MDNNNFKFLFLEIEYSRLKQKTEGYDFVTAIL